MGCRMFRTAQQPDDRLAWHLQVPTLTAFSATECISRQNDLIITATTDIFTMMIVQLRYLVISLQVQNLGLS